MSVPGWPVAFRGSAAIAAGRVTKDVLRGPRFRRVFPDVYVRAEEELTLGLRSLAAYRLVEGRGVLSGFSAAEVLDASCGPRDAPAEVTVPGGAQRAHPGLLVHRGVLASGEVCTVDGEGAVTGIGASAVPGGVRCTFAPRTAWDLARRGELQERVVGVDALARRHGFNPDLLLNYLARFPRARGSDRVAEVLTLADRGAGSPMETRLRLVLVLAGLPRPRSQWVVQDERARRAMWLDLAYPAQRIGIEYDGEDHLTPAGVRRDIARSTALVDLGWRLYRYTRDEIVGSPELVVAQIRRALDATSVTSAGETAVPPLPGHARPATGGGAAPRRGTPRRAR